MSRLLIQGRGFPGTALLLLLALVYAPTSGASKHYCFDGMEPAVSIHFDNLTGHDTHDDESAHVDLEKQLLDDNLVGKLSDLAALPASLLTTAQAHYKSACAINATEFIPLHAGNWQLKPPLRAPPQL